MDNSDPLSSKNNFLASEHNDGAIIAALASTMANGVQADLDGEAALVPQGFRLKDLERFQDRPRRVEETIRAHTLEGFLNYFVRYATDTTAIFGHPLKGDVTAVFDYHQSESESGESTPEWGRHVLKYSPGKSRQLKSWTSKNGTMMEQDAFAHRVEERSEDFVEPAAARMLEIARQFEATRTLNFQQATRLDSGDVQFRYEEETQTKGDMQVPEKFTIGIPLHKGGDRFELEVRFLFRIESTGLELGYKLIRLDEAREAAAQDVLETVIGEASNCGVPVYYASR